MITDWIRILKHALKAEFVFFPDAIGYYALKDAPLRACS